MRIRFEKGKQREFFKKVISNMNSPSLRGLMQFGINVKYSALKNYYSEERLMSEELFDVLCFLGKIDRGKIKSKVIREHWGQVVGGKKSRR